MDSMNYMFQSGFLGTRAPLFMDFVTIIVALLPFLVAFAIYLAKQKKYKLHAFSQIVIFMVSVIVLIYFETGVRISGGFEAFMKDSTVSYSYALVVLIVHIVIAILTLMLWVRNIFMSKKLLHYRKHRRIGIYTFVGIIFTSLTGIWVYFLMFVF